MSQSLLDDYKKLMNYSDPEPTPIPASSTTEESQIPIIYKTALYGFNVVGTGESLNEAHGGGPIKLKMGGGGLTLQHTSNPSDFTNANSHEPARKSLVGKASLKNFHTNYPGDLTIKLPTISAGVDEAYNIGFHGPPANVEPVQLTVRNGAARSAAGNLIDGDFMNRQNYSANTKLFIETFPNATSATIQDEMKDVDDVAMIPRKSPVVHFYNLEHENDPIDKTAPGRAQLPMEVYKKYKAQALDQIENNMRWSDATSGNFEVVIDGTPKNGVKQKGQTFYHASQALPMGDQTPDAIAKHNKTQQYYMAGDILIEYINTGEKVRLS